MISHLSKSIALFFANKNIIPKNEIDSYSYGYEVMLISMINWGIILAIMLITGRILETLLYMITVIVLRRHAGGYHAATHLRCSLLSIGTYIVVLLVIHFASKPIVDYLIFISIFSSTVIIFKYAPLVNKNNPIGSKAIKRHRIISRIITLVFAIICVVLFEKANLALAMSLGISQVSISLFVEVLYKNKHEEVLTHEKDFV